MKSLLSEYIADISFRFVRPHEPVPAAYHRIAGLLDRFDLSLEVMNTRIPAEGARMRRRLHGICRIPRMSTFALAALINKAVSEMSDSDAFVNVGVWHGYTLLAGMLNNPQKVCIGIDNFSEFGGPREAFLGRFERHKKENHRFFEMGYQEYFKNVHKEPIGFYIYDGGHSYEDQLLGLQLAEPFFSRNCIILVDDTNWELPRKATMDFLARSSYKYEIIADMTTYSNHHPTFWNGVIMLKRVG